MKISGTFFYIFVIFFFNALARAEDTTIKRIIPAEYKSVLNENERSSLITTATNLKLNTSRQWTKLLHIERNTFGIKRSQISDPTFFLSNEIRFSNNDELAATLLGFFEEASSFELTIEAPTNRLKKLSAQVIDHSQHPICRFPARLAFLKKSLVAEHALLWEKLPKVNCTFYSIYTDALRPKAISFVFSSYYSDSPGSAFGHTFFKISRDQSTASTNQELLDYGAGFAANAQDSNPISYALLGLFGGFTGTWTNVPYYYKVREYSDFEARDLWSYDLDLSQDEVEMLTNHLWEVGAHYYTYYFFTQNCAFHMLTVLEAAAPRLHLIEHVPFLYVIPSDSMKALFYSPGLVKNVTFRPSIRSAFLERAKRMDQDHFKIFDSFAKNLDAKNLKTSGTEEQRAYLLDAAIDLIDLRAPNPNSEKAASFKSVKSELLGLRAQTQFTSPEVKYDPTDFEDPSQSHGSSRASVYYYQKSDVKSGLFEYRFALHEMLDPTYGLPKNSQLEFFNFSFDLLPNDLKLRDLHLFKVLNINPINFFETKPSWGFDFGLQNRPQYCDPSEYACYLAGTQFRMGYAFSTAPPAILNKGLETMVWGMGSASLRHSSHLKIAGDTYLAPGFVLGMSVRLSSNQTFQAEYLKEFPLDMEYFQHYDLQYRWSLTQKFAVNARIINDHYGFGLNYYY